MSRVTGSSNVSKLMASGVGSARSTASTFICKCPADPVGVIVERHLDIAEARLEPDDRCLDLSNERGSQVIDGKGSRCRIGYSVIDQRRHKLGEFGWKRQPAPPCVQQCFQVAPHRRAKRFHRFRDRRRWRFRCIRIGIQQPVQKRKSCPLRCLARGRLAVLATQSNTTLARVVKGTASSPTSMTL